MLTLGGGWFRAQEAIVEQRFLRIGNDPFPIYRDVQTDQEQTQLTRTNMRVQGIVVDVRIERQCEPQRTRNHDAGDDGDSQDDEDSQVEEVLETRLMQTKWDVDELFRDTHHPAPVEQEMRNERSGDDHTEDFVVMQASEARFHLDHKGQCESAVKDEIELVAVDASDASHRMDSFTARYSEIG